MGYKFEIGQTVEVRPVFEKLPEYNGAVGRVVDRWTVEPFFGDMRSEYRYQLKFDNGERKTFNDDSLRRYSAW